MSEKTKKYRDKLFHHLGDKQIRVLLVVGVLGIALLSLSGMGGGTENTTDSSNTSADARVTTDETEQKLRELLMEIDGVGSVSLLITYEDSGRDEFLTENGVSSEYQESPSGGVSEKNTQSQSVVMSGNGSTKEPVLETTYMPTIKGVVVVCDGGGDAVIRERIINTVSTALQVGTSRIYVTQTEGKKGNI